MTTEIPRDDCGPEGCEISWLASPRLEDDADPQAFFRLATDAGWGDGLPLVPPTEARVREHVAASGRYPDDVLGDLPPRNGRCTVEKLAINTVMAGAPPEAMRLLCVAVETMIEPDLNLFALNATTCRSSGSTMSRPSSNAHACALCSSASPARGERPSAKRPERRVVIIRSCT